MRSELSHVRTWIFDLDNTLYPAGNGLFGEIEERMTRYICEMDGCDPDTAKALRNRHFVSHGTTLSGLLAERSIDAHHFLDYVHDVDLTLIERNDALAAQIAGLPGRKLVFTNGDAPYAGRVLDRLGMAGLFEGVHDIHATRYRAKPAPEAYQGLCEAWDIDPATALFAEDMARNLAPAKAIGMTTLWVDNGSDQHGSGDRDYIDFTTAELGGWLHAIWENDE